MVDAPMQIVRAAIALGQKIESGCVGSHTCFTRDVWHHINAGGISIRMGHQLAPGRIGRSARRSDEDDRGNNHAMSGCFEQSLVEVRQSAVIDIPNVAFILKRSGGRGH